MGFKSWSEIRNLDDIFGNFSPKIFWKKMGNSLNTNGLLKSEKEKDMIDCTGESLGSFDDI